MEDYKALYFHQFHHLTKIMDSIDNMNFGLAKELIIQAQQEAEERYLKKTSCAQEHEVCSK